MSFALPVVDRQEAVSMSSALSNSDGNNTCILTRPHNLKSEVALSLHAGVLQLHQLSSKHSSGKPCTLQADNDVVERVLLTSLAHFQKWDRSTGNVLDLGLWCLSAENKKSDRSLYAGRMTNHKLRALLFIYLQQTAREPESHQVPQSHNATVLVRQQVVVQQQQIQVNYNLD